VVDTAVAIAEPAIPAAAAAQITAWPNPFNPRVNVSWSLPAPARLDLDIFDLRGRLVQRMLSNAAVPLQGHVTWNGTDLAGRALPSGAYLVRLQPEGQQALVQRITLVR
ncbi:MAG: FlgD immunoglobulin-like domain containing protein, partial [Candidatus Krumholzibacteria bacterium]|nr:FlgD immunoglobulin-like domain containing protein [Candidatus Krumholzibacteria bacterium]